MLERLRRAAEAAASWEVVPRPPAASYFPKRVQTARKALARLEFRLAREPLADVPSDAQLAARRSVLLELAASYRMLRAAILGVGGRVSGKHLSNSIDVPELLAAPAATLQFRFRFTQSLWNSRDTVTMSTMTYQGLEVLYSRRQIAEHVVEMGAQITRDLNGKKLVMVGVPKGSAFSPCRILSRSIQADATFQFVAVSSYGKDWRS